MFIVYDIIYRQKTVLGYDLLIKYSFWNKTKNIITKLTYTPLIAIATKIKKTNRYINPAILALETHIYRVAAHTSHFI